MADDISDPEVKNKNILSDAELRHFESETNGHHACRNTVLNLLRTFIQSMPPRPSRSPKGSFGPPNDSATYRDLLLFEERLKTNAANLQRRKSRYQLFLAQLVLTIAFLLCEVVLPPHISLISIPYRLLLQRVLPDVYASNPEVKLHPYIASALLFVSVTTLVLVFASGMYSEKIAYANKYVPHANRALRSLNMYLNVRRPSRNPLSFFFPRPNDSTAPPRRASSPSSRPRSASTTRPIHTIPPSTNPRGELIFSSKVDKGFRESYERYRTSFERRREDKAFHERRNKWYGRFMFWDRPPPPPPPPAPSRTGSSTASRGRGSRSGTPPIMMKQRDRSNSPSVRAPLRPDRRDSGSETDMRTTVLTRSMADNTSKFQV